MHPEADEAVTQFAAAKLMHPPFEVTIYPELHVVHVVPGLEHVAQFG